jgi:hypothetical protein
MQQVFGVSGPDLARLNLADPQTPSSPAIATTEQTVSPPFNSFQALTDPTHSAIFWIGLAALLGLVLVSGSFRVQAMVGGGSRFGRR